MSDPDALLKPGRKTKLNPQVQAQICNAIAGGHTQKTAAMLAGICADTLNRWIVRGKNTKRGKYREFADALEEAREEWKQKATARYLQFAGLEGSPDGTPCRTEITKNIDGVITHIREIREPGKYIENLLKARFPDEFGTNKIAANIRHHLSKDGEGENVLRFNWVGDEPPEPDAEPEAGEDPEA